MSQQSSGDVIGALNHNQSGLDATLGVRVVEASAERVVLEYDIDARHRQPYGIVHGGVHCALVETACSTGAGLAAMERGQAVVGVENHTSFLRAVRSGRIRVTAIPLTRGRRSQVWEATARDDQDRIVSTGRVRLLCLDPTDLLAGESIRTKDGD